MPERLKPLREKLYQLPGETVWWLGEHLLRVEIQGRENLEEAQKHLEEGSLLVYFNHISFLDPGLVLKLVLENFNFPPNSKPAIFTSQKHLDEKRGKVNQFQAVIMQGTAASRGFTLLPIVQEYDRPSYPDFLKINLASLRKAIRVLSLPGGIILIAPEETRSKTGALQEAKEGIEMIFKTTVAQEKTLVLPIGMIGTEKIHKSGSLWLNPFVPIKIVAGEPISYPEADVLSKSLKLPLKDILMIKLAQLLPEEYWGFYEKCLIRK